MITNFFNLLINNEENKQIEKFVIKRMYSILPPGGALKIDDIDKIPEMILEKNSFSQFINNTNTRTYKNYKNMDGMPFVLQSEVIIAMRMLKEYTFTHDLEVPVSVEPFKNFLFNVLKSQSDCGSINYLTVFRLELYQIISHLQDQERQTLIKEIEKKLKEVFYWIEYSLRSDKPWSNAKKEMREADALIKDLLNKLPRDKFENEKSQLKKMVKFLLEALEDHEYRMPMLLLPTRDEHKESDYKGISYNHVFCMLRGLIVAEKPGIIALIEKIKSLNNEIDLINGAKKFESLRNIPTYHKTIVDNLKSILATYNQIENIIHVNNQLFQLIPSDENYEKSVKSLKMRLSLLVDPTNKITEYSIVVLNNLLAWESELPKNGVFIIRGVIVVKKAKIGEKEIKQIINALSFTNDLTFFNRDLRSGISWLKRIITNGNETFNDAYSQGPTIIENLKKMIPSELLVNTMHRKGRQIEVLLSYLMSLWNDINSGVMNESGKKLDDSGLHDLIAYLSVIYSSSRSSWVQAQRETVHVIWHHWSDYLIIAKLSLKNAKSALKNEEIIKKCEKLLEHIEVMSSCINKCTFNPQENPLSFFLKPIPTYSLEPGVIPLFMKNISQQIMPQLERVLHLYHSENLTQTLWEDVLSRHPEIKIEMRIEAQSREETNEWKKELKRKEKSLSSCFVKDIINSFQLRTMQLKLNELIQTLKNKTDSAFRTLGCTFSDGLAIYSPSLIYLESLNRTVDEWLTSEELLASDSKPKKTGFKKGVSFIALVNEYEMEKVEEDKIDSVTIVEEIFDKELDKEVIVDPEQLLRNSISLLLSSKTLKENQNIDFRNVLHHLGMMEELNKNEWPLGFVSDLSQQYLLHLNLVLELIMKTALSEKTLNTSIVDHYGFKQQIRATHRLGILYSCFIQDVNGKSYPNDSKKLKDLSEIMIMDRDDFYLPIGRVGCTLQELKELSLLSKSINEESLTVYQKDFCVTYLDKDSVNWKRVVEKKIREKEKLIRNLSAEYMNLVHKLFGQAFPKIEEKGEGRVLSLPETKALFTKSKVNLATSDKILVLIDILEKKLSSESIQEKFVEKTLDKCLDLLYTLREIIKGDTEKFKVAAAKMYFDKFGKLTEKLLLNALFETNPRFLDQTFETGSQTRDYRKSHELLKFVELLQENYPDFKLTQEMKRELREMKILHASSLRYPFNQNEKDHNQSIVIFQDQIRMRSELSKQEMSKECTEWMIQRYTNNSEDWEKKLNHDINFMWNEKILGFGGHILEMLNLLLDQK